MAQIQAAREQAYAGEAQARSGLIGAQTGKATAETDQLNNQIAATKQLSDFFTQHSKIVNGRLVIDEPATGQIVGALTMAGKNMADATTGIKNIAGANKPLDYTLSPGASRFGQDNNLIVNNPSAAAEAPAKTTYDVEIPHLAVKGTPGTPAIAEVPPGTGIMGKTGFLGTGFGIKRGSPAVAAVPGTPDIPAYNETIKSPVPIAPDATGRFVPQGNVASALQQAGANKQSKQVRVRVKGPNGETGTIEQGDELPQGWSIE
jgi:hypothetical protein